MKNHDMIEQARIKFAQRMMDAAKEDKPEDFAMALTEFSSELSDGIMEQARELVGVHDAEALASRGVRQLTSAEKEYYQSVIGALKSGNPKQALSELDVVLPESVIDAIFDDIQETHPILSAVNFQNTAALTEILTSTSSGVAGWGELTGTITDELSAAFAMVTLTMNKLTAFIPVAKAMLDLGPAWLDRYVRTILAEALATGLEAAIVDGDGDGKPIGMTRALTGATDSVYPRKTAKVITDLEPETIGGILDQISVTPNGKRRAVPSLLMVVSPSDYYTKVFPATTARTPNGSYNNDTLPYPMNVVVSAAMPTGFASIGLASRYFAGLGTSKGGKLEYSDEYKFLEDVRVYLIKLYGNGRPLDDNAFIYCDISGITPYVMKVQTVEAVPEG